MLEILYYNSVINCNFYVLKNRLVHDNVAIICPVSTSTC